MKKFLIFGLILSAFTLSAQGISSYKYIAVPDEFPDFKRNQYNLDSYLQYVLEEKGYIVIKGDEEEWSQELVKHNCEILRANPVPGKYFLKLKLTVDFTDCQGETVASYTANSSIDDFKAGYRDAMKKALKQLPVSNGKETINVNQIYTNIAAKAAEEAAMAVEDAVEDVKDARPMPEPSKGPDVIFKNKDTEVKFYETITGKFLLMDTKTNAVFAEMTPSSRTGVYRVVLNSNGEKVETFGFYDGNTIEIETETGNIILQKAQ